MPDTYQLVRDLVEALRPLDGDGTAAQTQVALCSALQHLRDALKDRVVYLVDLKQADKPQGDIRKSLGHCSVVRRACSLRHQVLLPQAVLSL